jgi:hypothetical protein
MKFTIVKRSDGRMSGFLYLTDFEVIRYRLVPNELSARPGKKGYHLVGIARRSEKDGESTAWHYTHISELDERLSILESGLDLPRILHEAFERRIRDSRFDRIRRVDFEKIETLSL